MVAEHDSPNMSNPGFQTATLGVVLGGLLIVVGSGAYVLSNFASVTALIPAIFGVLIALLGAIGRNGTRQRIALYGIGALAALGVLGSLRAVPDIVALVSGESAGATVAPVTQAVTIVVCLVLVASVGRYVLATR